MIEIGEFHFSSHATIKTGQITSKGSEFTECCSVIFLTVVT